MTRDQWLNKCAERLREKVDMEPGEAAAYAINLSESQADERGRNPAAWGSPIDVADAEARVLADDGQPGNLPAGCRSTADY